MELAINGYITVTTSDALMDNRVSSAGIVRLLKKNSSINCVSKSEAILRTWSGLSAIRFEENSALDCALAIVIFIVIYGRIRY